MSHREWATCNGGRGRECGEELWRVCVSAGEVWGWGLWGWAWEVGVLAVGDGGWGHWEWLGFWGQPGPNLSSMLPTFPVFDGRGRRGGEGGGRGGGGGGGSLAHTFVWSAACTLQEIQLVLVRVCQHARHNQLQTDTHAHVSVHCYIDCDYRFDVEAWLSHVTPCSMHVHVHMDIAWPPLPRSNPLHAPPSPTPFCPSPSCCEWACVRGRERVSE
jgi:hypothetical protein